MSDKLPKRSLKTGGKDYLAANVLPTTLQEALMSLYGNYDKYYYQRYLEEKNNNQNVMPPVMIVVCNNTAVSELVYRWIAGFERETPSGKIIIEKVI